MHPPPRSESEALAGSARGFELGSQTLGQHLPHYKTGWPSGRTVGWDGTNSVDILGLLYTSCVTLNKALNLAKAWFPHL